MKIIQINAVYGYGSTGRATAELHSALVEQSIESFVVCSRTTSCTDAVYHIGSELDIKIHGFMSRISGMQGYFSYYSTKKLLRYINGVRPDIVYLSNLHANYINFPLLLQYLHNMDIAVVVTLHDCWFFTGKCCHYIDESCTKWKTECGNCPKLKTDNVSWFFDRTQKMLKDKKKLFSKIDKLAVIGVSDWIISQASESLLSSAKIIRRIYNWIDLEIFKPIDAEWLKTILNLHNMFIVLGVASVWSERKGLYQFIEISKKLGKEYRIILVGSMKDNIKLPENILHIPQTDDVQQMAQFYSVADVFVQLSTMETFGIVTAEALACGTPAVVYNSSANPELIGDGCGYIAEKNDLRQVIDYIEIIRENRKERYSEKCIKYAQNNFDKSKNIDMYIAVFKELIEIQGEE